MKTKKQEQRNYVYLFVRKDLSAEQIAVQSCHAAIESARHYISKRKKHPSLVILQVANEEELNSISLYLVSNGIKFKEFREEFFNDSLTAIATELITGERRLLFKDYKLLKINHMREYTDAPKEISELIKNGESVTEDEAIGDGWKNLPYGIPDLQIKDEDENQTIH